MSPVLALLAACGGADVEPTLDPLAPGAGTFTVDAQVYVYDRGAECLPGSCAHDLVVQCTVTRTDGVVSISTLGSWVDVAIHLQLQQRLRHARVPLRGGAAARGHLHHPVQHRGVDARGAEPARHDAVPPHGRLSSSPSVIALPSWCAGSPFRHRSGPATRATEKP